MNQHYSLHGYVITAILQDEITNPFPNLIIEV